MRYIDSLNLQDNHCFILIEPGKGYMIPVLKQKFPNSKILSFHVDDTDVIKILDKELQNIDSGKIRIIEWRPSMNFYKEKYLKLLTLVVEYIKRMEAGNRTVSAFGKRWLRNFFKNLEFLNEVILYKETELPVIITGSGPSLENDIQIIKEVQEKCLIIAASSSVMALNHYGIKPDLIITTDGGSWAKNHFISGIRGQGSGVSNIAVNLCAALPSQSYSSPMLILNDGSLWQNIVLHELEIPSVIVGQKGTVTASAVELGFALSKGNIYLAGMDLSINDIRSHVKPYAFDTLLFEKANRFSPVYSQTFVRSGLIRDGGSLGIYKAWFKEQFEVWPKRIFNTELTELKRIKKKKDVCFKAVTVKKKNGVDILINNLTDDVRKELEPLIGEDAEKWLTTHC